MITETEAWKSIFKEYGFFTSLSPDEAKTANREKRLNSPLFQQCYFEQNPVSWKISEKLHNFLELAEIEPTKASKILIDLVQNDEGKSDVNCKQVLERLWSYARQQYLTDSDRSAIFDIFSKTADQLSLAMGPPEPLEFSITMMCCAIAQDIVYPIEKNLRVKTILKGIEDGSAFSWLMFFVRVTMMQHGKINQGRLTEKIVLSDMELVQIQESALNRITSSLGKVYESSDPKFVFICWHELSEDKTKVLAWVNQHTQDDHNLILFTNAFRAICIGKKTLQWRIQKDALEKFVNIEEHKAHLERVAKDNCELQKSAQILLSEF